MRKTKKLYYFYDGEHYPNLFLSYSVNEDDEDDDSTIIEIFDMKDGWRTKRSKLVEAISHEDFIIYAIESVYGQQLLKKAFKSRYRQIMAELLKLGVTRRFNITPPKGKYRSYKQYLIAKGRTFKKKLKKRKVWTRQ